MPGDNLVKLFITGDFCPIGQAEKALTNNDNTAEIFGEFSEIIRHSDLAVTNLECPLTGSQVAIRKIGPNLKACPDVARILKEAGFNLVTLANNHIYDYDEEGLEETLKILADNAIDFVGAGKTLSEAQRIFYREIRNVKVAIVNFCEVEFSCANNVHGGANPIDLIDNVHQIQQARENADHVIVIVHGGHEHYHYPSPETLKRYRFFVEQGVSAVIGHHTHCVGGHEEHMGVPIFYSLGNFFFPSKKAEPFWYEGYAVLLKLTKEELAYDILPYEQCKDADYIIKRLAQDSKVMMQIESISAKLSDKDFIVQEWRRFITDEKRVGYLTRMSMIGRYPAALLRRLKLLPCLFSKKKLLFTKQYLSCEAHKEVARDILDTYLDTD